MLYKICANSDKQKHYYSPEIYIYILNHLNMILYSTKLKFIVLMMFYCEIDIDVAKYKVIIYTLTN